MRLIFPPGPLPAVEENVLRAYGKGKPDNHVGLQYPHSHGPGARGVHQPVVDVQFGRHPGRHSQGDSQIHDLKGAKWAGEVFTFLSLPYPDEFRTGRVTAAPAIEGFLRLLGHFSLNPDEQDSVGVTDILGIPLDFDPGTIIVYDRGYSDYSLFAQWTAQGVFFVTRMKENALYGVVGERDLPQNRHILKDELIHLAGPKAEEKCPYPLRRIEVYVPETDEILVFLTNNMDLGATPIAAIYKDRWQIEIFFKILKQNLKIKTFVGTSANAVKIQIWTALIAILMLRYLQFLSKFRWSLSNLVALLRMNLFTHRDLWSWLNQPFDTPPVPYEPEKLTFDLA